MASSNYWSEGPLVPLSPDPHPRSSRRHHVPPASADGPPRDPDADSRDLIDAVNWAIKKGVADRKRIAIFGGSYGGYAALVGAAFTPDVFACAVDIVGPSNLVTLLRSIPPYWEPMRKLFAVRVGDPDKDEEFLRSRSPLFRADRIHIPLLIAQGKNDPREEREAEQIVAAVRKAGKPVEYLLFPDEGHGFARPENRLKFYAAAEAFLARHLGGGRVEPAEGAKTSP